LEFVARVFVENVKTLEGLRVLPFFAVETAYNLGRAAGGAAMKVSGSIEEILGNSDKYKEYLLAQGPLVRSLTESDPERIKAQIDAGLERSARHLSRVASNARVTPGVEAWLAAQIVSGWTSFETLAGDLWEAALNCHPNDLAELGTQEKTVPIILLQKYGFDLSQRMGSLLKEKRPFDRLENIRENYNLAFHIDGEKINEVLSSDLLDVMSSVRNLLVHHAGIVDERYLRRIKSLPFAPRAEVGDRIKLDGDIVDRLSTAMKLIGSGLLHAVDDWLDAHTDEAE
jgi:hypothetical protein